MAMIHDVQCRCGPDGQSTAHKEVGTAIIQTLAILRSIRARRFELALSDRRRLRSNPLAKALEIILILFAWIGADRSAKLRILRPRSYAVPETLIPRARLARLAQRFP